MYVCTYVRMYVCTYVRMYVCMTCMCAGTVFILCLKYKIYLRNNKSMDSLLQYKHSRNACNIAVRNAKRKFLLEGLKKLSPTLWKGVSRLFDQQSH